MARGRGLFDRSRQSGPPENEPGGKEAPLSIAELTRQVKAILESNLPPMWVEGELSNFRPYSSGHCYFTLKDAQSQLSGVLFRNAAESLRFAPQDGMKVLAFGRVRVYEPRGQYQFVAERLEPVGLGALAAQLEALKAKLAAEGLFDEARKRPLPNFPRRIALVTSPSGAAVRDLFKVILSRWPKLEIVLAPVRVQGDGAAAEIARAITLINKLQCADVMIVGRGGGSIEDLWAFNEEPVVRAIAASKIPTISAVGHEIDYTLADLAADVRAATPSHAGELVIPELAAVEARLADLERALPVALLGRVELARSRLERIASSYALRRPEERLAQLRQQLDDLQERLLPLPERAVSRAHERFMALGARLDALSPLRVLERGYSVTHRERDGAVIKEASDVKPGERIVTRLHKGKLIARVEEQS